MSDVERALSDLHFHSTVPITSQDNLRTLIDREARCGIYVLHFATGEFYVGQAIDVARRFLDHRKNHPDICRVSFKSVDREDLDDAEVEAITRFERAGFLLRNISLTSVVQGERELDALIPRERQERWLHDLEDPSFGGYRHDLGDLRRKYERRFARFAELPNAEEISQVLRAYIWMTIPDPIATELDFWSVSCLPPTSGGTLRARVNIFKQEVAAFWDYEGVFCFEWQVARSLLERKYFGKWSTFRLHFQGVGLVYPWHFYPSGGADQMRIGVYSSKRAHDILKRSAIIRAMRTLNLRLMRRGPTWNNRFHCPQLADVALLDPPAS